MPTEQASFSDDEIKFLTDAAEFFENPGFFVERMCTLTHPLRYAENKLPEKVRKEISKLSRLAIEAALKLSIKTIPTRTLEHSFEETQKRARLSGNLHTVAATVIGGVGGFLGLLSLPIELPITSTIMLRSIADISQKHGNDLSSIEGRLECLYVFSLGSNATADNEVESAYYTSRIAFAELFKSTSAYIATHTAKDIIFAIENGSAPVLIKLIGKIAAQFEIGVTKKLLAQATPIAGSIGGASLNLIFTNYYNNCAKYHFGLERLEKVHGFDTTRDLFNKYRKEIRPNSK